MLEILARRGEVTVGEIVSFIGFANLLIGRLDQVTGFVRMNGYPMGVIASDSRHINGGALTADATAGKTLFKWLHGALGWTEDEARDRIYFAAVCRCFPGKKPAGGDQLVQAVGDDLVEDLLDASQGDRVTVCQHGV